tara:strand:+ start:509 stop:1060 length:552 start_codon:yes stop_codon:yes gene_type:complete
MSLFDYRNGENYLGQTLKESAKNKCVPLNVVTSNEVAELLNNVLFGLPLPAAVFYQEKLISHPFGTMEIDEESGKAKLKTDDFVVYDLESNKFKVVDSIGSNQYEALDLIQRNYKERALIEREIKLSLGEEISERFNNITYNLIGAKLSIVTIYPARGTKKSLAETLSLLKMGILRHQTFIDF